LAYSILEAPWKPEMRIAGRYHPDSSQLDGAAPVEVRAGEEISGIDFRLPRNRTSSCGRATAWT
jgi:hypothetical protein